MAALNAAAAGDGGSHGGAALYAALIAARTALAALVKAIEADDGPAVLVALEAARDLLGTPPPAPSTGGSFFPTPGTKGSR
jgi:hypothetical protein